MERFWPTGVPERDAAALVEYKTDPAWRRIYSFLRRGYWHVTNPVAWKRIRKIGRIEPSGSGNKSLWEETGASRFYRAVALFDFVTPTEDDVIKNWGNCWDVLTQGEVKSNVLLRLDRRKLRSNVISGSIAQKSLLYIPHCEVWFPGRISIDAVRAVHCLSIDVPFGELKVTQVRKNEDVNAKKRPTVSPEDWLPGVDFNSLLGRPENALDPDKIELDSD